MPILGNRPGRGQETSTSQRSNSRATVGPGRSVCGASDSLSPDLGKDFLMIPSNRHPGTAARALSRAFLMQTPSGLLTARACRRPAARARPPLEGLEDRCGRRVFAQPRLDRRGGIRFTRLPRRHFALHAVFMAFLSSCPLADAGFIASSDAAAINASIQDRHMLQNTTNLAGTETSASISDPYFGSAMLLRALCRGRPTHYWVLRWSNSGARRRQAYQRFPSPRQEN